MKKNFRISLALISVMLVAMFGLSGQNAFAAKVSLTLLTGETGGTYYVIGAGVGKLVGKYNPGYLVSPQSTGGASDNAVQLGTGNGDMAIGAYKVYVDSYNGDDSMFRQAKKANPKLRLVWFFYPMPCHLIVKKNSKIKTMMDFKGKKVVTTPGGAFALLTKDFDTFGFKKGDIRLMPMGIGDGADALRDGKVEAIAMFIGVPNPRIMDLASSVDVRFVSVPDKDRSEFLKKSPWYAPFSFKKDHYPGVTGPVKTYQLPTVLIAMSDVPEDVVYNIVKTIAEHTDELGQMHAAGKTATLENFKPMTSNPGIPLHDGTKKYLKEKGVSF